MADLASFAADNFDLKSWVNQACSRKAEEETMEKLTVLDRYLARLEMRLHLAAEDVEASIESEGKRALGRIPIAVSEVAHVKGDVVSLDAEVRRVLAQLSVASASAAESTVLLRDADLARIRMEEASTTLKDASELSDLWASVGPLFAEGDVQRIAIALGTMRRSVALMAHVPEFQGSAQRLAGLEERFQSLVEPQLAAALSSRDGPAAAQLASLLTSLSSGAVVERLYVSARLPHMLEPWEHYDPAGAISFFQWLPNWCSTFIVATEGEASWCLSNLSDLHPQLEMQLLAASFRKMDGSFRSRLSGALSQAGRGEGGAAMSIQGLISVSGVCEGLMLGVQKAFVDAPVQGLQSVAAVLYTPLVEQVERYGAWEAQQLDASFPQLQPPGSGDIEACVSALQTAADAALSACEAALQRCQRLCEGAELPSLALVADDRLAGLLRDFEAHVAFARARSLPDEAPSSRQHAAKTTLSAPVDDAVLPLLSTTRACSTRLQQLCAAMNASAAGLLALVTQRHDESLGLASVRLQAEQGLLARQLRDFSETAASPGFILLPTASRQAASFSNACQALIYDVLMHTVRSELRGYAKLPAWGAASPNPSLNLPSFSAYPQAPVTAAGEYLMMLPQHLEALLAGGEDSSAIDAEWLDKVAAGAAELLRNELGDIRALRPQGAQQLSADLEYFTNVLSALGVSPPPVLATWQVASGWQPSEFTALAAAAVRDGADRTTLEHIAEARGLPAA